MPFPMAHIVRFRDLVAAVVADGLGELTFALVAKALSDVQLLEQMLTVPQWHLEQKLWSFGL